jgi:MFS family permease
LVLDNRAFVGRGRPIAVAVFYTIVGSLPLFLVTAYSVTLRTEFDFGTSELGFAVSGFFAGAIAAAQVAWLVDRFGTSIGLRASALMSASAGLLIATIADSWVWLAASLIISGAANSVG